MTPVSDPIATGFAASIARPGGHLTGMSMVGPDLSGKRLGYLREIMPDLKSIAFIGWTRDQNAKTFVAGIEAATAQAGIKLVVKMVDAPSGDRRKMMAALKQERCPGRRRAADLMGHQDRIILLPDGHGCDHQRLSGFALSGGLFTYGIDDRAQMQRALFHRPASSGGANPEDHAYELRPTMC